MIMEYRHGPKSILKVSLSSEGSVGNCGVCLN